MNSDGKYFWNIDRIMWLVIGIAVSSLLLWLTYHLRDVLLPFFVACVIAYLLQPIADINMKVFRLKGRTLASVLTVIEVSVVVGGLLWLTLPTVISELDKLGKTMADISSGKEKLPEAYAAVITFVTKYFDPAYLSSALSKLRVDEVLSKGSSLLVESASVIMKVVGWLLTLIYVLFILIDYPEIARGFKQIVPLKYRPKAMEIINDITSNMNRYFRGQGMVALCAIFLYCVGFLIVGLPLAVPMGLLVGILYMIPYFQYVTLIPVAVICIVNSIGGGTPFLPEMGKCILVYVFSQSICDYVITPHVMGKELGLNPAIILLSLSVWGSLLGIVGMIIALPVTALLISYYQHYISNRK